MLAFNNINMEKGFKKNLKDSVHLLCQCTLNPILVYILPDNIF